MRGLAALVCLLGILPGALEAQEDSRAAKLAVATEATLTEDAVSPSEPVDPECAPLNDVLDDGDDGPEAEPPICEGGAPNCLTNGKRYHIAGDGDVVHVEPQEDGTFRRTKWDSDGNATVVNLNRDQLALDAVTTSADGYLSRKETFEFGVAEDGGPFRYTREDANVKFVRSYGSNGKPSHDLVTSKDGAALSKAAFQYDRKGSAVEVLEGDKRFSQKRGLDERPYETAFYDKGQLRVLDKSSYDASPRKGHPAAPGLRVIQKFEAGQVASTTRIRPMGKMTLHETTWKNGESLGEIRGRKDRVLHSLWKFGDKTAEEARFRHDALGMKKTTRLPGRGARVERFERVLDGSYKLKGRRELDQMGDELVFAQASETPAGRLVTARYPSGREAKALQDREGRTLRIDSALRKRGKPVPGSGFQKTFTHKGKGHYASETVFESGRRINVDVADGKLERRVEMSGKGKSEIRCQDVKCAEIRHDAQGNKKFEATFENGRPANQAVYDGRGGLAAKVEYLKTAGQRRVVETDGAAVETLKGQKLSRAAKTGNKGQRLFELVSKGEGYTQDFVEGKGRRLSYSLDGNLEVLGSARTVDYQAHPVLSKAVVDFDAGGKGLKSRGYDKKGRELALSNALPAAEVEEIERPPSVKGGYQFQPVPRPPTEDTLALESALRMERSGPPVEAPPALPMSFSIPSQPPVLKRDEAEEMALAEARARAELPPAADFSEALGGLFAAVEAGDLKGFANLLDPAIEYRGLPDLVQSLMVDFEKNFSDIKFTFRHEPPEMSEDKKAAKAIVHWTRKCRILVTKEIWEAAGRLAVTLAQSGGGRWLVKNIEKLEGGDPFGLSDERGVVAFIDGKISGEEVKPGTRIADNGFLISVEGAKP